MAARQFCIPIDLNGTNANKLEIKLSCGFLTWELDEASIDFSNDQDIIVTRILASTATDEQGRNATQSLTSKDGNYLVQPAPGNSCEIIYQLPQLNEGMKYDYYLHSSGYYEHVRNYTGIPDRELLKSFRQKGTFSAFTYSLYTKLTENSGLTSSSLARK